MAGTVRFGFAFVRMIMERIGKGRGKVMYLCSVFGRRVIVSFVYFLRGTCKVWKYLLTKSVCGDDRYGDDERVTEGYQKDIWQFGR